MKLVRKARLHFKDAKSDKVYEVDLCEVGADRYVVNFRYGKRGANLREGTKTATPVDREEADRVFDSIVVSKINKGYRESDGQYNAAPTPAATPSGEDTAETRERIIDSVLQRLHSTTPKDKHLARLVWRAGLLRLSEAAPVIGEFAGRGTEMLDYCVAWALGRMGPAEAVDTLEGLLGSPHESVRRIAREALLQTAPEARRAELLEEAKQGLPPLILQALDTDDTERLHALTESVLTSGSDEALGLLENLYLLSGETGPARDTLLDALKRVPLKPNYFKALRHIYKAAEFRGDGEVFGRLAFRIETSAAGFNRSYWGSMYLQSPNGRYERVEIDKELSKPDSRLAYSGKTRDYLRRRSWRTLKRLGEAGSDEYIKLALGVLLPFDDTHGGTARRAEHYEWVSNGGRWQRQLIRSTEFDTFAPYLAFNHILREHSPRYRLLPSARAWAKTGEAGGDTAREEAFPELWDRHPEALLRLLTQSRCAPVHDFAAPALAANTDYCAKLAISDIATLLRRPYAPTQTLGLNLAKRRLAEGEDSVDLIKALLEATLEEAHTLARQWILDHPAALDTDASLWIAVITCEHADVRRWARELGRVGALGGEHGARITAGVVAELVGYTATTAQLQARLDDIEWMLLNRLQEVTRGLDLAVIEDLLSHDVERIQVLGARLLVQHQTPAQDLPPSLFSRLMSAENPELRGVGVELFGKLPDEILLGQQALLAELCVSTMAQVRAAARPVVKRLAAVDEAFGRSLLEALMPYIFRSEPEEGFHADLLQLIKEDLGAFVEKLDKNTVWRLLHARSKAAQDLGAHLLANIPPTEYSVRQWAHLGRHDLINARQWAWDQYRNDTARIRGDAEQALRIMDSDWDDTREFAFAYFRETFGKDDWTPELIIGVCDSVREDIQRFGRELITEYFEDEQGPEYLLKLSQHPSINVQLFVTNFLERFAGDDNERLNKLAYYFTGALSQVNRGRVAKTRIFEFLRKEALKSHASARLIADIIARQSATLAIGDKAACIETLLDIARRYPDIELPLNIKPPQIRGAETRHGI